MKKLITLVIVLAIMCTLPFQAVAAENSVTIGEDGSQSIDVTGKSVTSSTTSDSYSIEIQWTDMTFTYESNITNVWNANDHSYSENATAGWDKTEATITVTNHSNVDVDIVISYTPVEGTGITGTLENGIASLAAGEVGKYDSADSMTAVLTISGTPTAEITANGVKIGSITVTVQ